MKYFLMYLRGKGQYFVRKMKQRRYIHRRILLCIVTCVLALTACGQKGEPQGSVSGSGASQDSNEGSLTIYCQEGIALFVNAVREYKQLYDVDINLELFENLEEMESRITTETMSGGGPDVYFLSGYGGSLDIQKMMKNGSFYALDEMMEEEKSFLGYQEENYYSCMIQAGQYEGKQYVLPFSFNLMQFYADANMIAAYYPGLLDGYDMRELITVLKEECVRAQEITDYTSMMFEGMKTRYPLSIFLEQAQTGIVDYSTKQILLDKDMVQELLEFWKTYYDMQRDTNIVQKYGNSQSLIEHMAFLVDGTSMLNAVRYNVSRYGLSDMEPFFYVLPAWEEEDAYTAVIQEFGAVNAGSDCPEEAYRLLRYVMDYQMEYNFSKSSTNLSYYLPVNKKILQSCLQSVTTQRGIGNFDVQPLTGEYETQLESILGNINDAVIPNPKIGSIIQEVMAPYINGDEEFDTCYTKLENRLKLYLSE